jgi:hypothetical protein
MKKLGTENKDAYVNVLRDKINELVDKVNQLEIKVKALSGGFTGDLDELDKIGEDWNNGEFYK